MAASNVAYVGIDGDTDSRLNVNAKALLGGGVAGEVAVVPEEADEMSADVVYSLQAHEDFNANVTVFARYDAAVGRLLDLLA